MKRSHSVNLDRITGLYLLFRKILYSNAQIANKQNRAGQ